MNKRELVRNYLKKFPNTPSLTIAKKIYAEHSKHFTNLESVRSEVRTLRGLSGERNKKRVSKELFVPKGTFKNNPFKLPPSDAKKARVFYLPKSCNNILLLSDLHIPFHDINAVSLAIQYGLEEKINCIVINGDLLDFYLISRFTKTKYERSIPYELKSAREFLTRLNEIFPGVPIYFLLGNHDVRLQIFLAVKAPELLDVEEFKLEELLHAKKHNMTVIGDTTLVKAGKLAITHGHILIRGVFAPVNPARGSFLRAKASVIIGHTHKYSTHSETDINGKVTTCYSTGCLCELNPEYSPFANNFSHGFARIVIQPNGNFSVFNKQIVNGELMN